MSSHEYGWPMSRRQLIGAGAGLSIAGLPGTAWAQGALPVADTHVHLFNAADLPAAAFIRYTLLPAWVTSSAAGRGIVDYFVGFMMSGAMTAEEERNSSPTALASRSSSQFGIEGANFIKERKAWARSNDPALAQSYEAMESALLADRNYSTDLLSSWRQPGTLSTSDRTQMLANALTGIADKADRGRDAGWSAGEWADRRTMSGADLAADPYFVTLLPGRIGRLLEWAVKITYSRRKHLRDYLRDYRSASFAPRLLVNHLVDYDHWLDGPPPRSSIEEQIAVFSVIAKEAAADGVTLRTFAPFCPLRLATELALKTPTLFDRLTKLYEAKQIAGFKLYPPMGWAPSGNASPGDVNFDVQDARARIAITKWTKISRDPLGKAIDDALAIFFKYCGDNKVPLMAHARRSNGPIELFKKRADPAGWESVAATHGLKLQLGHLIHPPAAFGPSDPHDGSWKLAATRRMLGTTGPNGSMVYGDLSYMPDLIGNPTAAKNFFVELRGFLGDAGLRRVSFGSDWIMLAQEKDSERYLAHLWRGMTAANYGPELVGRILYGNAAEYLG